MGILLGSISFLLRVAPARSTSTVKVNKSFFAAFFQKSSACFLNVFANRLTETDLTMMANA
jgi:hypothetical protein